MHAFRSRLSEIATDLSRRGGEGEEAREDKLEALLRGLENKLNLRFVHPRQRGQLTASALIEMEDQSNEKRKTISAVVDRVVAKLLSVVRTQNITPSPGLFLRALPLLRGCACGLVRRKRRKY